MTNTIFAESLTPKKVSEFNKDIRYSIPIYQRLFEWDNQRIVQLLDDLYQAYKQDSTQPYYIGMLTSNNDFDLIDGQQRFTVMMLLGFVMSQYDKRWESFLFCKGLPRLRFKARTNDNDYLMNRCDGDSLTYENLYMKRGKKCIEEYMNLKSDEKEEFSSYVFDHLNFFISFLPQQYSAKALNKYFETMNSTGKNLENHEILKVKLLRAANLFNKEKLSRMWNTVSDMDMHLVRRKRKEERQQDISDRYNNAYSCICKSDIDSIFSNNYINSLSNVQAENENEIISQEIGGVKVNTEKPAIQRLSRKNGFHSILSFSEFLLQVLWLNLDSDTQKDVGVKNFFDVNKLQETFQLYWKNINPDQYIISLFKYRLLYDRYIINISNEESTYDIELNDDSLDDNGNHYREMLIMYQSMLYVNSSSASYYLWIAPLLSFVGNNKQTSKDIYIHIKKEDEKRHPINLIKNKNDLSFNNIDRYWFWKLDFYVWLNRKDIFQEDALCDVADNYAFRRNRSIEHIAPQTPERDSTLELSYQIENCFGNLVMISSSQNSSLQNSTFEIKRAKVQSHIQKELRGTIESLKMLMIYQYETWNEKSILEHQEKCIEYIQNSFK